MPAIKLPHDTRQAMHLEQVDNESWLSNETTEDSDCWGMDPALAAEKREEEIGTLYFDQPTH